MISRNNLTLALMIGVGGLVNGSITSAAEPLVIQPAVITTQDFDTSIQVTPVRYIRGGWQTGYRPYYNGLGYYGPYYGYRSYGYGGYGPAAYVGNGNAWYGPGYSYGYAAPYYGGGYYAPYGYGYGNGYVYPSYVW